MRKIIHIDMDCFYAAVEEKYRPELKGKPLGIGGPPDSRSVLCTANYQARKFGIRAAMPSSQAVRRCPQLVLIPPNFPLYKKESEQVHSILARYTDKIEPLSLDEAFLDVSESTHRHGSATWIAQEIRNTIFQETGLAASAGVAPNKMLAKIASDWQKPNGLFVIRPEHIEHFIKDLPVEKLYGIGKVTAQRLHDLGLLTCQDLQQLTDFQLKDFFGSRGSEYGQMCRGLDTRPVVTERIRKSLSVEETFNKDFNKLEDLLQQLPALYEDWLGRLQRSQEQPAIRGAVVKLKYFDFQQSTLEQSRNGVPSLQDFAALLKKIWARRGAAVRLLGIGARLGHEAPKSSEPRDTNQLELFEECS